MNDMDLSRFINLYKSGNEPNDNQSGFCCFGLFKEGDYIFNQRNDLDESFIIKKLEEDNIGPKTSEIVKNLKEKNLSSNVLVVIDHNVKEAMFFCGKSKMEVSEALIKSQKAYEEGIDYFKAAFLLDYFSEYEKLAYSVKDSIEKDAISVVNVSRGAGDFIALKELGLDKMAKDNNVSKDDLTFFIAHHELGHSLDENNKLKKSEMKYNERAVYNNKLETYADIYASICSVQQRGDTKAVELWSDYRNANFNKCLIGINMTSYGEGDDYSEKSAIVAVGYNITPALDKFVVFANKKLKEDENYFKNLSSEQIAKLARETTDDFSLSKEQVIETKKELLNFEKGENVSRAVYRSEQTMVRNGYSYAENADILKNIKGTVQEIQGRSNSRTFHELQDKKARKQVDKMFVSNFISEKRRGNGYYEAFLGAVAKTRKEIIKNANYLDSGYDVSKLKSLDNILKEDKEAYKSAFAYVDFMDKVELPENLKKMNKSEAFSSYIETKKAFVTGLRKVSEDISNNNINEKTASEFKAVLINAKYCHYLARKAKKVNVNDELVADFIKSDNKREYPKILDEFFINSKDALQKIPFMSDNILVTLDRFKNKSKGR
ncbi:MAG: hypothetical protein BWY78_00236 [Alphaproteobacteria bacterium ADurb.Bin438]|nr:MAG: hypothetical protein BWY78_00236 [Alphaproteobacteria bacterium ADurb.Bin438]